MSGERTWSGGKRYSVTPVTFAGGPPGLTEFEKYRSRGIYINCLTGVFSRRDVCKVARVNILFGGEISRGKKKKNAARWCRCSRGNGRVVIFFDFRQRRSRARKYTRVYTPGQIRANNYYSRRSTPE